MKRKSSWLLVAGLLLLPLASCSGESSSTTGDSSTTSSSEPVYLYDDYRRDGSLSLGIRTPLAGSLGRIGYESPISLFYQANEKRAYGDDASLQIYPYGGLEGTDAQKLSQASTNRQVLHSLMSLSHTLLKETEIADMGMLPVLVDRYATDFESLSDVPDETISFNSIDGTAAAFVTQKEGEEDSLLFYSEGENLSESLSGIDLSTIQINAPALLSYLQELLSGNAVFDTFLSSIGGIVNFLVEGVDIEVDCPDSDNSTITFRVNDEGKQKLEDAIENNFGTSIEMIQIGDISFSLSVFNDDILINQIESATFSLSVRTMLGTAELYFDARLDREATALTPGFFQEKRATVDGFDAIYQEARDFFETVSAYAPFKTSLTGEEEPDLSKIDVSDAIVPSLEEASSDYFSLSEKARKLLGPVFEACQDEGKMEDLLLSRHQEGVDILTDMIASYNEEGRVDESNFETLFGTVADYLEWEQGVLDNDGKEALDALYAYLSERMDEIEDILSGSEENALDSFLVSPVEDNLEAALELDDRLQALLSLDRKYLSGERLARFEGLEEAHDAFQKRLQSAGHAYLATRLSGIDYEGLAALGREQVVLNSDFFDKSLLTESEKENVASLVAQEGKSIRQDLLSSADSLESLNAAYLALGTRLTTLRTTESTFLGSDDDYLSVVEFYRSLQDTLE